MFLYVAIITILLLLSISERTRNSNIIYFISVVVLVLIASIRDIDIGTDTVSYYNDFISNDDLSVEIGYSIYRDILRVVGNYGLFLFCSYLIIVGGVAYVSSKLSSNKMFSLFLFVALGYYTYSFNIMRQFMAISMTCWALYNLERNKPWHFFVWTIFAASFHLSSLIVLLVLPLRKLRFRKKIVVIFSVGTFIIGFFFPHIILRFFSQFGEVAGKYASYLFYVSDESRNLVSNLGLNILFVMSVYFCKKEIVNSIYFKAYVIYIILFNIIGGMHWLTRLAEFFSIIQVILFPLIIDDIKYKLNKVLFAVAIVCYSVIYFFSKAMIDSVLPYNIRL